jgi:hypothetical protein
MNGCTKRRPNERIPLVASMNGDFVIDFNDEMFTARDIISNGMRNEALNSINLYPVYDAKNGRGVGKMKPKLFIDKMLGSII